MTSAFLVAGVPAVVATLWPVDDEMTVRLMAEFYDRLAGGDTVAEALRRAQVAVRNGGRTRQPYYWAGFVVVGDGDVTVALHRRSPMERGPVRLGVIGGLLLAVVLSFRMLYNKFRDSRRRA